MTDLKPCPFCGGDALYDDLLEMVCCTSCTGSTEGVDRWNTRADLVSAKDAEIKRLREAVVDLNHDLNTIHSKFFGKCANSGTQIKHADTIKAAQEAREE